jgi:hypothetical protein
MGLHVTVFSASLYGFQNPFTAAKLSTCSVTICLRTTRDTETRVMTGMLYLGDNKIDALFLFSTNNL